jgi:hypothetical protein
MLYPSYVLTPKCFPLSLSSYAALKPKKSCLHPNRKNKKESRLKPNFLAWKRCLRLSIFFLFSISGRKSFRILNSCRRKHFPQCTMLSLNRRKKTAESSSMTSKSWYKTVKKPTMCLILWTYKTKTTTKLNVQCKSSTYKKSYKKLYPIVVMNFLHEPRNSLLF